jgi:hypothetical protein
VQGEVSNPAPHPDEESDQAWLWVFLFPPLGIMNAISMLRTRPLEAVQMIATSVAMLVPWAFLLYALSFAPNPYGP